MADGRDPTLGRVGIRLRIDDFQAYYDVEPSTRTVSVLRILAETTGATPWVSP